MVVWPNAALYRVIPPVKVLLAAQTLALGLGAGFVAGLLIRR